MALTPGTHAAGTRQVTLIGHNSQIVATVGFFVAGGIGVRVYTAKPELEVQLAPYPDVQVTVIPAGYQQRPTDLPEPPYLIGVDQPEIALRVRSWLPRTLAVFLLGPESRRRKLSGFLPLMPTQAHHRLMLLRRLAVLKRVDSLMSLASDAKQPLILMYGDPDPDAIGAALGLATIWRAAGATPLIRYTGEVQRYQNKLLLGYLKEPIERLREAEKGADLIAVVDAQPGFWVEDPPKARVIIDHHPVRPDTAGEFLDLRESYGATSTILAEYLVEGGFTINRRLATALLYGLTSDTDDLQRHASSADIKAYDALHARADRHFLARLNKSRVPMGMLDYIAWGISHRVVFRDLVLIHFGSVPTTDVMVQAADLVLLTCGINWVVCAGIRDDKLTVIFRGDGHHQDVGKRASLAFGKLGSAGGHRTMGRAQIELNHEHVDNTVDILVDNLFKRMSPARRQEFIRVLRNHLHGAGPAKPEDTTLS